MNFLKAAKVWRFGAMSSLQKAFAFAFTCSVSSLILSAVMCSSSNWQRKPNMADVPYPDQVVKNYWHG